MATAHPVAASGRVSDTTEGCVAARADDAEIADALTTLSADLEKPMA
jgi:hypothetical protein